MTECTHERETPYTVDELESDLNLIDRATRLYPDSYYLQIAWVRAVCVVRATARGWLLDTPVVRVRGPL